MKGGLFKDCWLCDEPLLFLSVFDETELCDECEEINIRPVHVLSEVLLNDTNLRDMIVERALEDMVRGFRRIARQRFETCPQHLLTREEFEQMLRDYYYQYRYTFFGKRVQNAYNMANTADRAARRKRAEERRLQQGRHRSTQMNNKMDDESEEEMEEDITDSEEESSSEEGDEEKPAANIVELHTTTGNKKMKPVEMDKNGPQNIGMVLDSEWKKAGATSKAIELLQVEVIREVMDTRFEEEVMRGFKKRDNKLFEVLLLERYAQYLIVLIF